jgi:hypothetical protein
MSDTATKAIKKIVARLQEEMDGIDEMMLNSSDPMTTGDFADICMQASTIGEWASNLSNFAAVCEFGEQESDDFEKYVPNWKPDEEGD